MSDTERWLSARAEIHDLLVRAALSQDARDWDAHGACFEPNATYTHPKGELSGVDAIVDRARRGLSPLDASQHLVGTILVTPGERPTEADSVSYFHAQHVRRSAPGGDLLTITGTYRDRLVERAGCWRIVHRTQEYTWRDGNDAVIVRSSETAVAE